MTVVGGKPTVNAVNDSKGLHLSGSTALKEGSIRIISAAAVDGASTLHVDGALEGTSAARATPQAYFKTTIGGSDGWKIGAAADPFEGDILEIIVYERAAAECTRISIEEHLAAALGWR